MSLDRAETASAVLSFDPYDGRRGQGRSDQPEAVRHVCSPISSNRRHIRFPCVTLSSSLIVF